MQEQQHSTSNRLNGNGHRFLDQVCEQLHRDPLAVSHTMSTLLTGLQKVRREMPREEWQEFCRNTVPKHELAQLIREDPFTLHSVRKPRGYPGDAALLDYIYGCSQASSTPLGQGIFDFTINTPPCRAVRSRARIIAGIIDRMAAKGRPLRILSIACGHLREADMAQAVQQGMVSEYVAFDQDARSLQEVETRLGGRNIKTIRGSIGDLLLGKQRQLGGFDMVYAAGLYDYLSQKLATRMTSWMFNATRPGGITLLTNFLQDIGGAGYMEAFMEWELIYRTPQELTDTTRLLPKAQVAETRTYSDEDQVVFVEVHKAMPPLPAILTFPTPQRETASPWRRVAPAVRAGQ